MPNIKPIVATVAGHDPAGLSLLPLPCDDVSHHKLDSSCTYPNKYFIFDEQKGTAFIVHAGCESVKLSRADLLSPNHFRALLRMPEGLYKRYKVTENDLVEFVASTVEEIEEYRTMEKVVATAVSGRSVPPPKRLSPEELAARYPCLLSSKDYGDSDVDKMERFLSGTANEAQPKSYTPESLLLQDKSSKQELAATLAKTKLKGPLPSTDAEQRNGQTPPIDTIRLLSLKDYPSLKAALQTWPCCDIAHTTYSSECSYPDKSFSFNVSNTYGAIIHKGSKRAPHLRELRLTMRVKRAVFAAVGLDQQAANNAEIFAELLVDGQVKSKEATATKRGKKEGVLADKQSGREASMSDLFEELSQPMTATPRVGVQPRAHPKSVFQAGDALLDFVFKDAKTETVKKPRNSKSIKPNGNVVDQDKIAKWSNCVVKLKRKQSASHHALSPKSRAWDNALKRAHVEGQADMGAEIDGSTSSGEAAVGQTKHAEKPFVNMGVLPRQHRKTSSASGTSTSKATKTNPAPTTEPTVTTPAAASVVKEDDGDWEAVDAEEAAESEYVFI